jgi:hypothetical protein
VIYRVKSGDSPYKIAKKLGVPFAALIAANSQKPTTVIAGVRTFASLVPDEELFAPVGSGNVQVTLEADTALDVEATAAAAITVLNADQNFCTSVRHPGTPVNVAIHNFKKAWNASGQDVQLPINTGKYEPIVARALAVVLPNLPVPDACDAPSPHRHRGVFIESRGVAGVGDCTGIEDSSWIVDGAGVGDDTAVAVSPGNIIKGGFGTIPEFPDAEGHFNASVVPTAIPPAPVVNMPPPPVVSPAPAAAPSSTDTLTTLAAAAASALSADPNHCASVAHPGSAVNTAVHAFKQAWNAANPGSKVPVGTGKYEASVAAALTTLLGAGVAPDGCGGGGKHAQPPPPAPPVAVAVVQPPPAAPTAHPAPVAASIVPLPPAAPVAPSAPRTFAPPPVEVLRHRPAPPVIPPPVASASVAAQALASVDPCDRANVGAVWTFQQSVGEDPDGKYGTTTATALAKQVPGAPGACRPRPSWWAPHGQKNHPDEHRPHHIPMPPPLPDSLPMPDPTAAVAPPEPTPVTDSSAAAPASVPPPPPPVTAPPSDSGKHKVQQAGLVPPVGDKDGFSTGALIAGSIGAAALIGIVAAAASGKGKTIIHKYRKAPAAAPAASKEKR